MRSTGDSSSARKVEVPLTRGDVDRIHREAGEPGKLDLRGMNLKGVDLAYLDLNGAILGQAD
ncbi:MAG: hypothetical protein E6I97_03105, partial [Chloroflexi bacterium]